jgi:hypothetical protein
MEADDIYYVPFVRMQEFMRFNLEDNLKNDESN